MTIATVGCFTQRRPIAGRDINPNQVNDIVPNVTTRQQLVSRFGKPDQVTEKPEGGEELLYTYRGDVEKTTELILYAKKTTESEHKNLRVLVRDGVVVKASYTNSLHPAENLSK